MPVFGQSVQLKNKLLPRPKMVVFRVDSSLRLLRKKMKIYLLVINTILVGFTPVVKVYFKTPSSPKQYILPLFT